MNEHQHIWKSWVDSMHRWGVNDFIASLLEAAGPLTLLAAQVIYIGKPMVAGQRFNHSLVVLAELLENPGQTQAFISLLREESQRELA